MLEVCLTLLEVCLTHSPEGQNVKDNDAKLAGTLRSAGNAMQRAGQGLAKLHAGQPTPPHIGAELEEAGAQLIAAGQLVKPETPAKLAAGAEEDAGE